MVPPSAPLDLPALVALMYRADWTTLSLSATLTVRTMREPEAGADAEEQPPLPPRRAVRRPAAGPGWPFEELLIPATLLSRT